MVMLMSCSNATSLTKKQATRMVGRMGNKHPLFKRALAMPMKHNTNHTHSTHNMYSEQVDVPWEGYHACFNAWLESAFNSSSW